MRAAGKQDFGLLCIAVVPLLFCQTDVPPSELVAKAARNHLARARAAEDFNYSERVQNLNFDAKGKVTLRVSDTYDVVFIEGAPYRIHIAHNDRPISGSDLKKETDKMQATANARRSGDHRTAETSHNISLTLPIAQLPIQFDLKSEGREVLDGHPCERIRATPKPVFQPATEEEMLAKAMEFTLWIDREEAQIVKIEARIISAGTRFRTGTSVIQEFTKIKNEVWLPKQMRFHGLVQDGRKDVMAEAEQTYSNYKKFRVN